MVEKPVNEPAILEILRVIKDWVADGDHPRTAAKRAAAVFNEDDIAKAYRLFQEEAGRILTIGKASLISKPTDTRWYMGVQQGDVFWPAYENYLLDDKGWGEEVVKSIDESSHDVLAQMQSPGSDKINTRGLVLGYVQSGKTASYTALIAKAADRGYKVFMVLSGMTNSLRRQTHMRLQKEIRDQNKAHWIMLSQEDGDFSKEHRRNAEAFLNDINEQRVFAVVKKNTIILDRIISWFRSASNDALRSCPVLIIDDEADQASVNTAPPAAERSAVNRKIVEIVKLLPKCAYVGYTATPFANVLINPEDEQDLYPSDFIFSLPQPDEYFGPQQIFGMPRLAVEEDSVEPESLDIVRLIGEEEVAKLKPKKVKDRKTFDPILTPSLIRALRYFIMACAARRARGQEDEHTTMLIHTTLYIDVHEKFRPLLNEFLSEFAGNLRGRNAVSFTNALRSEWDAEIDRLKTSGFDGGTTKFDELEPHLLSVVRDVEVVIDNSLSDDRINYDDGTKTLIAVGGNTLSRGLTLEGLIVSFYIRAASAYDTLLQMGRWFGYRHGYEDLPRIWMTDQLRGWFQALAGVEQEIRDEIARYSREGLKPSELAVKIRTHPEMGVTSPLKMRYAERHSASFEGKSVQTTLFRSDDAAWVKKNTAAVSTFIAEADSKLTRKKSTAGTSHIWHGASSEDILSFLHRYQIHEGLPHLGTKVMKKYIKKQNDVGELLTWNIVIKGKERREDTPEIEIIDGLSVPLLSRTRLTTPTEYPKTANIKALMTHGDRVIDLHLPDRTIKGMKDEELRDLREDGSGCVILYPIDKDSKPAENSKNTRNPLKAADHVLGAAFVFPSSRTDTLVEYVSVRLPEYAVEEEEWPEEETEAENAE